MSTGIETTTVTTAPGEPVTISKRDATVMELAAVIAGSRDFPDCRTPEKAAVRILAGREMGVGPIASVIGIRVQSGRVSMDATLMAGCIKRSGQYDYKIELHTNEVCKLAFFENGEVVGDSGFSADDAKMAGLAGKDTWKQYPRNMLFARALSNGARWYCPAIFGGAIYTHEELGYAVDEEGRAIETESGNGDLCTLDQRKEICRLVEAVGDSMPGFLAKVGIRLLDELSQHEAAKEIKRLEKRLLKAGESKSSASEITPSPSTSAPPEQSPSQTTIVEAFDESRKPSTQDQRDAIIGLVQFLTQDEEEVREIIKAALAKRSCRKLSDLNHLQAAGLIEALQVKLAQAKEEANKPPFRPDPAKTGTAKS